MFIYLNITHAEFRLGVTKHPLVCLVCDVEYFSYLYLKQRHLEEWLWGQYLTQYLCTNASMGSISWDGWNIITEHLLRQQQNGELTLRCILDWRCPSVLSNASAKAYMRDCRRSVIQEPNPFQCSCSDVHVEGISFFNAYIPCMAMCINNCTAVF